MCQYSINDPQGFSIRNNHTGCLAGSLVESNREDIIISFWLPLWLLYRRDEIGAHHLSTRPRFNSDHKERHHPGPLVKGSISDAEEDFWMLAYHKALLDITYGLWKEILT